jgi:tripartite-type tricarboxylate transporter receptor subunit TctC
MNRRKVLKLAFSTLAVASVPRALFAQGYPDRPIRLIVPFAAGGVVDVIGRLWAAEIKSALGTVVVENQSGGGGMNGAADAARSTPDGYTILLGNTSTQVLNPAITDKPPYDPATAFQTVSIVASSAVAIAVNPGLPPKTLGELVTYIKANPGKLSYGSPGAGTFTNLAGEIFKQSAGIPDLIHVPYRGAGPGMSDLVSGHIPTMVLNITNQSLELHRTGKIRIVAVMTPKPLAVLPDVPTAQETLSGVVASLFTGLFVPAGTPQPIVDRIASANRSAMASVEFQKKLVATGFDSVADTPAEAQRFVDAERARLVPLVKSVGFKPE